MFYVITDPCVRGNATCDTACAKVCPVDAIAGGPPTALQLFIDPEACICCGACAPECPVSAIFEDDDVPAADAAAPAANAAYFAR